MHLSAGYRLVSNYSNFPKFLGILKVCCNQSKILTKRFYHGVMPTKVTEGNANREDPDQTAPGAV